MGRFLEREKLSLAKAISTGEDPGLGATAPGQVHEKKGFLTSFAATTSRDDR
jgi:hypothetical protein